MDDIQKILNKGGAVLAKIFSGKELKNDLIVDFEYLEPTDIYAIAMGLVAEQKYSEAEDFLFTQIEKNYTSELFLMGESLIESVIALGNEKLSLADYSLEDALSWQTDWSKLYVPLDTFENRDARIAPDFSNKKKGKKLAAKKNKRQVYNETPQV